MKKQTIALAALLSILCAMPAFAAQVRVFVADMNAIGAANKDDMKATLQMLLSSRLSSDRIMAVASAAEADAIVTGTYVTIGKVFSVDALAKTAAGRTLTRAFVQGEGQDELIPAVGKLADKLSLDLVKIYADGQLPAPATAALLPGQAPRPAVKSDFIKNDPQLRQAPVGEFIKPVNYEQGSRGGWVSKRLTGAANLMAVGKSLPDGGREIFLAEDRRISYYRQSSDMKLVAEVELKNDEKIISLDTIESGSNIEIYASIVRGSEIASQAWQVQGDKLVRTAEKLPYFFRAFSLGGGAKKLYVQSMGRDSDFFGDVFEASRAGGTVSLKNPLKMPRFANLYNFNQFRDSTGVLHTVAINPDNYLVVYDTALNELWRSNDKFGESELYFQKEDPENVRTTGDKYRWIFMNQQIQVSSKGEILIGKNDGFWVLGNARSYKKGAVYCLFWNGSSLEEKWRTRDTQNYMPGTFFDEASNELLILQTAQRPGVNVRGASSLSIKKVE